MKRAWLTVLGVLAFGTMVTASGGGATGHGTVQPGDPCTGTIDCTPGSICWNAICVGDGSLRFSLSWNVVSDYDLHVKTPSGTELYYGNRSGEGGTLDVDDCVSNSCKSTSATHVENIYWSDTAAHGTYEVWVVNFNGSAGGSYTIETSTGVGTTGSLPATSGAASTHKLVTY
jgi:hypothetical protein